MSDGFDTSDLDRPETKVPEWVFQFRRQPGTLRGAAIRALGFAYRLFAKAMVLAIFAIMLWSYLGPTPDNPVLWRVASTALATLFVPFLFYRWVDPPITPYMLRTRKALTAHDGEVHKIACQPVRLHQVARSMRIAVVISEDLTFYRHIGFNPSQILKAYQFNKYERQPGRNRRGGSTISQQLAKNLFLLPTQTWTRKITEAVLTLALEGLWPKRRILEVYLNIVEFGNGTFGVEAAAERFFNRSAATLTEEEAALLTAALPGPRIYRVEDPPPAMDRLRRSILQRMGWCADWVDDPL